jgi:hypothetical protein
MTKPDRDSEPTAEDSSAAKMQMRIDPPHVLAAAPEGVDVVESEAVEMAVEREMVAIGHAAAGASRAGEQFTPPAEQLQLHAEQIADHLRRQQEHIDRREADLHAQMAEHENSVRSARLWFGERQQELAAREAELAGREHEIEEREAAVDRADREQAEAHERAKADQRRQGEAFGIRQRELDERQQSLDRQETEHVALSAALARCAAEQKQLDDRLREEAAQLNRYAAAAIDTIGRFLRGDELSAADEPDALSSDRVEPAATQRDIAAMFGELIEGLKRLRSRQRNLEEAETLLNDGQAELDDARRQLEAERSAACERFEAERRRAAENQAQATAELERQLHAIKSRAEQVERRSAAVDQLRAEVLRTQREALELRLATDELWAQMIGVAPPAALSQSLAQIRGKLAEQYRLERSEMAGERKELEMLAERLERERERVQQQKHELERWAANRQADIEGQAGRLAAREQQLDRRQAELDQLRVNQLSDRQAYEREIRRLLAQLRRDSSDEMATHAA